MLPLVRSRKVFVQFTLSRLTCRSAVSWRASVSQLVQPAAMRGRRMGSAVTFTIAPGETLEYIWPTINRLSLGSH
jgi:hypothetical protein